MRFIFDRNVVNLVPLFLVRSKRFIRVLGLLLPFFIFLSVALIFLILQNRRYHSKNKEEIFSNELNLRKLIQTHKKDEMEIEPNNVELYELLGEGKNTHTHMHIISQVVVENSIHIFSSLSFVVAAVASQGAFGIVRKGILKPNNKEIAVKMLKGEYCSHSHHGAHALLLPRFPKQNQEELI